MSDLLSGPAKPAHVMAVVFCMWCTAVVPAEAEWAFGGYLGAAHTMSNTPRLSQPGAGTDVTFASIDYFGESFTSPIYYGFRITYSLPQARWIGVETEFTHIKVYARTDQRARISGRYMGAEIDRDAPVRDILQALSITHGFNLALANLVVRRALASSSAGDGRVMLLGRIGLGPTILHTHSEIGGASRSGPYEIGAPALHLAGGIEVRLWRGVGALADYRLTRAVPDLTVVGGRLHGPFTAHHAVFGIVWHP